VKDATLRSSQSERVDSSDEGSSSSLADKTKRLILDASSDMAERADQANETFDARSGPASSSASSEGQETER
jgi:hypothetical protein